MVTRGKIGWEKSGESYEVVVTNIPLNELETLARKIRAKIKEYKETRYLTLLTGNVKLIFMSEKTKTQERGE